MRAVLAMIARVTFILAIGSVAVAIAIGRYCMPEELHLRHKAAAHREVNGYLVADLSPGCRFLDAETGQYVRMMLPDNDLLLFGQGSPWRDELGNEQVVGRWLGRDQSGGEDTRGFGLARYTYPGGAVLNRIPLEVVPSGNPCWFPDMSARVIYAGTDGLLYQFAFEDEAGKPITDEDALQPVTLSWKCKPPGIGRIHVEDPIFLSSPGLEGRLIVALSRQTEVAGERYFLPSELYWLQLNARGTAIVGAGRLLVPNAEASAGAPIEERLPSVATTPDGTTILAYLNRKHQHHEWQIRLVPIEFDAETKAPRASMANSLLIADKSAAIAPSFSPDGLWLNGILLPERSRTHADRFSVMKSLETHESSLLARASGSRRVLPGQLASGKSRERRRAHKASGRNS